MTTALTRDDLVAAYHASGKPRERWLVGAEFERHLICPATGAPLAYEGEPGIRWLLETLAGRGWSEVREGDTLIALHRERGDVTLEPGGQFELSGSPFVTAREVMAESRAFADQVAEILDACGVRQIALGFTPFTPIADVSWVPKGRYRVMREHLSHTGELAHHMMKGTAAVQATYDYADEADCARKVRLATLLGPLTTATFANSPYAEGRATGFASWRGHIWTRTDPARTGFPEASEHFTFEAWVDWLLQVPMMFYKDKGGQWRAAQGRTFADWMADPASGPTLDDWELHLTSVFPEVRTKRAIEVRGADCVKLSLAAGFVAMWRGLFYDSRALDQATELALAFASHGTQPERFAEACRHGLRGEIGGRRLASWAEALLDIAEAGLQALDPDDVPQLAALQAQVASGRSPAHDLLDTLGDEPDPAALLETARIIG
ncbi:MAG: glutamate-cysteine ligase family protein [Myxococcota bacterium]